MSHRQPDPDSASAAHRTGTAGAGWGQPRRPLPGKAVPAPAATTLRPPRAEAGALAEAPRAGADGRVRYRPGPVVSETKATATTRTEQQPEPSGSGLCIRGPQPQTQAACAPDGTLRSQEPVPAVPPPPPQAGLGLRVPEPCSAHLSVSETETQPLATLLTPGQARADTPGSLPGHSGPSAAPSEPPVPSSSTRTPGARPPSFPRPERGPCDGPLMRCLPRRSLLPTRAPQRSPAVQVRAHAPRATLPCTSLPEAKGGCAADTARGLRPAPASGCRSWRPRPGSPGAGSLSTRPGLCPRAARGPPGGPAPFPFTGGTASQTLAVPPLRAPLLVVSLPQPQRTLRQSKDLWTLPCCPAGPAAGQRPAPEALRNRQLRARRVTPFQGRSHPTKPHQSWTSPGVTGAAVPVGQEVLARAAASV